MLIARKKFHPLDRKRRTDSVDVASASFRFGQAYIHGKEKSDLRMLIVEDLRPVLGVRFRLDVKIMPNLRVGCCLLSAVPYAKEFRVFTPTCTREAVAGLVAVLFLVTVWFQ